jgi:ATP-dependent exoDNAse (exonuclease V) beta subunit
MERVWIVNGFHSRSVDGRFTLDEMRLLYVAFTREQQVLDFCDPKNDKPSPPRSTSDLARKSASG